MRFGSGRFALCLLLAATCLLAASCSLPPGTIELTVASDPSYDGGAWTGTLRIVIRDSKSGELVAGSTFPGYTLDSTDPYEYSYAGAGEGRYIVAAYLDLDDNLLDNGDVIPTGPFPNVDVLSEQTTTVSILLNDIM